MAEHWERFGHPLLCFAIFAADHPDDLALETYADPENRTHIVVLRTDRRPAEREWRPLPGHFLFKAADVDDIATGLRLWLEAWAQTAPSLGLFAEFVAAGDTYSASRFLKLYTTAEVYWKATHPDRPWSLRARLGSQTYPGA